MADTAGTAKVYVAGITVGTEAGDVIPLTIQAQNIIGVNASRVVEVLVTVYESTMVEAIAGAFTMAVGAAGTLISDTAQARVLAQTNASGLLNLDLTDAAAASGKTVHILAQVVDSLTGNTHGSTTRAVATFD